MGAMEMEAKAKQTRRQHSKEFRQKVIAASRQPGVSISAVALAHGLNASLLRRWIKAHHEQSDVGQTLPARAMKEPLRIAPATLEPGADQDEAPIRIDMRRSGLAVQIAWPATRTHELNGLLKELLP